MQVSKNNIIFTPELKTTAIMKKTITISYQVDKPLFDILKAEYDEKVTRENNLVLERERIIKNLRVEGRKIHNLLNESLGFELWKTSTSYYNKNVNGEKILGYEFGFSPEYYNRPELKYTIIYGATWDILNDESPADRVHYYTSEEPKMFLAEYNPENNTKRYYAVPIENAINFINDFCIDGYRLFIKNNRDNI